MQARLSANINDGVDRRLILLLCRVLAPVYAIPGCRGASPTDGLALYLRPLALKPALGDGMGKRIDARDVLDPDGKTIRSFHGRIVASFRRTGPNSWDDYERVPGDGGPISGPGARGNGSALVIRTEPRASEYIGPTCTW